MQLLLMSRQLKSSVPLCLCGNSDFNQPRFCLPLTRRGD